MTSCDPQLVLLGVQVRRARCACGLSQQQVADRVCAGRRATISELERGLYDPTTLFLLALAGVLGQRVTEWLEVR